MRILIIIPSYKPAFIYGGPIRSVSFLAESLVEAGHVVTVYTTMANGDTNLEVEPGRKYKIQGVIVRYFRRLTKGHSNLSPDLLSELYKTGINYDVVHIHSWWNLVAMPATLVCKWKGIIPVISPRGTLSNYTFKHRRSFIKKAFHFIGGRSLLQYAFIHCTSIKEEKETALFVQDSKRYIIPNLLELPAQIKYECSETSCLKIIFLGRIDPAKNLEVILNAVTHNFSIPYQLTIIGEGQEEYVQKLKSRTAGYEEIKWVGTIDGRKKFEQLAMSDLLVLPSHTENYGNVIFESLSQGTPVLVSPYVGAKDYVLQHQLGWVVDGGEDEWRGMITKIFSNKAMLNEIRKRAPDRIQEDFKKEEQVKAYIQLYNQVSTRLSV